MKNSKILASSKVANITSRLFDGGNFDIFSGSKIVGFLNRVNNNMISMLLLMVSFLGLWYESFFSNIGLGFVENYNLGLVFLAGSLIFCDKKRLKSSGPLMYILLFIVVLFVSGLLAAINGLELRMLFTGILIFCQFGVAFIISSTYKQKNTLIDLLITLSIPLVLLGCYQGLLGGSTSRLWVSSFENLIDARAYGFFGSPNILGSLLMISIIMALFRFFESKKWYYLCYIGFSLVAIALTFSRSAWVGLVAGLLVSLFIKNWRYVALVPFLFLTFLIPSIRQRLLSSVSSEYSVDSSLDGRIWAFNNAVEIFKTSPIIGTGPGTYGGQTALYYDSPVYLKGMQNGYVALPYTDNQWVQLLTQTGLVGMFMVSAFFISLFVKNIKQYFVSKDNLSLGVVAVTVAVIVNGLSGNIWEFSAISVLSGAYLGLGNDYEK